jgi:hypothetical protein
MRDDPTKIMQNMKNVTMVDLNGGTEKLTQNVYKVRNVRPSDSKVNKTLQCDNNEWDPQEAQHPWV